jgi:taurine dioxygenase
MAEALEGFLVRPTGAALGADIEGVYLSRALPPATVAAIKKAWADHLVLRFRGQRLDDEELMRFSRLFGELDLAPVIAAAPVAIPGPAGAVASTEEGPRFVSVISNIIDGRRAIGALGAYEAMWHTDMSYNPAPPSGSALYALEVPPEGGDTGFANMIAAYESLPEELRRQVRGGAAVMTRAPTAPASCAAAFAR